MNGSRAIRMLTRAQKVVTGISVYTRVEVDFFFSSRRRHTRFDCDWSSDVCSSDLEEFGAHVLGERRPIALGTGEPARILPGDVFGEVLAQRALQAAEGLRESRLVGDRKGVG